MSGQMKDWKPRALENTSGLNLLTSAQVNGVQKDQALHWLPVLHDQAATQLDEIHVPKTEVLGYKLHEGNELGAAYYGQKPAFIHGGCDILTLKKQREQEEQNLHPYKSN
jgi:hypothetical protein